MFQHDIKFSVPNGDFVAMKSFSSNKFRNLYLSTNFSPNFLLVDLQYSDEFLELRESIDSVVDFIHENSGFLIIGWYKCGLINNRSLVSNNGNISIRNRNYSKNIQVDKGELNYRVIEILPTDHAMLYPTSYLGMQLNAIKFYINMLH